MRTVKLALRISVIDFSVISGLRTLAQQREYFETGKSHTMDSRHLTGHAVDLAAWKDGASSYASRDMFKVGEAMKAAAKELGLPMRWGGAWHIEDITRHPFSMGHANKQYDRLRKSQGRRPFHDLPTSKPRPSHGEA